MLVVAEALLAAAERREPVSVARANGFARARVEMTEIGRLAFGVFDGGLFAGTRLVELAGKVVGDGMTQSPLTRTSMLAGPTADERTRHVLLP